MLRVWKRSPLLRLLLPFVGGILLQIHVGVPLWPFLILAFASAISFFIIHFRYKQNYYRRHLGGLMLWFLMCSLGVLITQSTNPLKDARHIANLNQDYEGIELRLTEAPVPKSKSLKVVGEVIAVGQSNGTWSDVNGLLMLYLEKDSNSMALAVDDTIIVAMHPYEPSPMMNPFEFNYKKYLQSHYVYSQLYAGQGDWILKGKAERHSFLGYFISWRESMLFVMRNYGVQGQEYAVLSALVLGKTSEIDYHLMLSYASAGAIHILAVSGLHVALIYLLLSPLIKRLFPRGKYRLIKTIIPVALLWLYAGITGFSPSVLRAAWMFTCFIISDNYAKNNNIYNTMSLSALILLWWNPYIIMEVGFQLSYLAVLGIVVLQRKINTLIYSRFWLVRWAWSLTAVSISAQLATFALGLLYFHQFPNWFLVSNLFVIPLSTVILYVSLAFFAFVWCPPIANVLIRVSEWLTWIMNESMLLIDRIPYSITQGISITVLESYLIAGITVFMSYWLFWKKPKAIVPSLCCMVALCITQVTEKTAIVRHQEICIHQIHNHTCITYANGEEGIVLYDNGLLQDESRIRFHLKNYWNHLGIKNFSYVNLDSLKTFELGDYSLQYPFLQIADKRFAFVDSTGVQSLGTLSSDYYIFDKSSKAVFIEEEQLQVLKSGTAILGDGLSFKKKKFLIDSLNGAKLYDLTNGALIIRNKEVHHFSEVY